MDSCGPSNLPDGHVFFPGDSVLEGMLEWPERRSGGSGTPCFRGSSEASASSESSASSEASGSSESMGEPGVSGADDEARALCQVAGGVVIAHPYPPDGATMDQPVVYRIAQSCRRRGLATLRFNFRGVGRSLGTFSGTEEHRDVQAAAAFLAGRLAALEGEAVPGPSTLPVALAGYSFGSVMAARAAAEGPVPIQALALVGFVVSWDRMPGDTLARLGAYRGPVLAVCAENDSLGYPEEVERVLQRLGLDYKLRVIEGAGHFLEGRQREVGECVASFLAEVLTSGR